MHKPHLTAHHKAPPLRPKRRNREIAWNEIQLASGAAYLLGMYLKEPFVVGRPLCKLKINTYKFYHFPRLSLTYLLFVFLLPVLKWSSWTECTATCGKRGIQMRFLRCENKHSFGDRHQPTHNDLGGCQHEPQTQTRSCRHLPPCHKKSRWIPVK